MNWNYSNKRYLRRLVRGARADPDNHLHAGDFDTNTSPHHHFLDQRTGELADIPSGRLRVTGIPTPPAGATIAGVEVIVRVRSDAAK